VARSDDFRVTGKLDEVLVRYKGRYRFGNGADVGCGDLSPDGDYCFISDRYAAI